MTTSINTPQKTPLIQDNPANLLNRPIGLYANRPIAISGQTAYGISLQDFKSRAESISKIFASSTNWTEIDQTCAANNINIIVATDIDPIWKSLPALESQRKPIFQNPYYAVFSCGSSHAP